MGDSGGKSHLRVEENSQAIWVVNRGVKWCQLFVN
jgi:hypothetical protein